MKKSFSLIIALALIFSGAIIISGCKKEAAEAPEVAAPSSLEASLALEDAVLALTAADGQSLIKVGGESRTVPPGLLIRRLFLKTIPFTGGTLSLQDGTQLKRIYLSPLKMEQSAKTLL